MMSELWNTGKLFDYAKEGIKKAPKVIGELSGALPAYRALKSTVNGKPEIAISEIPKSAKNVGEAVIDQTKVIGKGIADSAKETAESVKELPKKAENWLSKNEVTKNPQKAEPNNNKEAAASDKQPNNDKESATSAPNNDKEVAKYEAQLRQYGFDENTDEKTAQKNLIDMLSDLDLVSISENGNIRLKPYSPQLSTVLQRSLGALSFGLTLASGGVIPPIPISKLTGAEEKEEKRKQMWDEMGKRLSDVYGDILSTEKKGQFKMSNENIVRAAGDYERLHKGEAQAMEQSLQNALAQAEKGTDLQKSLAEFSAHLSAESLPFMVEAMRKHGMSKKDIAEWVLAQKGSTADPDVIKWIDSYIGGAAKSVGEVVSLF